MLLATGGGMLHLFRRIPVVFWPLLVLGALAVWILQSPDPSVPGQAVSRSLPPPEESSRWEPLVFPATGDASSVPNWDPRRGSWRLDRSGPRPGFELLPEPMVEGKLLYTKAMRGSGGIRALLRGQATRRAFPRFSVGLHLDRELHLQADPAKGRLTLVSCSPDLSGILTLTEAALPGGAWDSNSPVWLELLLVADSGGQTLCEGRWWKKEETRPREPVIRYPLPVQAGVFFAAVQGAPFALRSIVLEDAAVWTPRTGDPTAGNPPAN